MQTVRNLRKRSGFTLVELLIVIIIIGILAGAMLLVAGSGTDSAEATKIVSDLRSMKAAALLYFADNSSTPLNFGTTNRAKVSLDQYSDMSIETSKFSFIGGGDSWWVGRKNDIGDSVVAKLKGMKDVPLYGNASDTALPTSADVLSGKTTASWIWTKAR